jgi:alanine racemase
MSLSLEQTHIAFKHRPTYAEVCLDALRDNLSAIQRFVGPAKVMAVVKANGYGHGFEAVAKTVERAGAASLGVAYIEEALELRRLGVSIPILVFGGLLKDQLDLYLQHDIDVTASSVTKLEQIDEAAFRFGRRARVHIKIDTGLERIGVHHYSSSTLFEAALRAKHSDVVGVYSHFADVRLDDLSLTRLQLERFLECVRFYEDRAAGAFLRHIAGSGGVMALRDTHLDMVRPGISLYGVYPGPGFESILPLKPVLQLKSQVVYFKVVKKGAGVSYGHIWTAPNDTRVVTIPLGYGDGYMRAMSNRAEVLIRGNRYPVIGAVCMDQLMVNIGTGEAYNGDEVVLIGKQKNAKITVEELASAAQVSPYEVLVNLNQRIPRVFIGS